MIMKTVIAILILLCFALTGCGNGSAPDTTPAAETTLPSEPLETFPTDPVETTQPTEETTVPTQTDAPVPPAEGNVNMVFDPVDEKVTAKIEVNLRSVPSQGGESVILHTMKNGETVKRTGVSAAGWSELSWKGKTCYAVSSYLTTDLNYKPPVQIQTPFTAVDEMVTPKEAVNLRTLPSTKHPDVEVVVKLEKGEVVKRTGINPDVGWSRVEWNGQTLYCISSYLRIAVQTAE